MRERIHAAKKEEEAIALADSSTSDEETESTYVTVSSCINFFVGSNLCAVDSKFNAFSVETYSDVALVVMGKPGEHLVVRPYIVTQNNSHQHFLVIFLELLFCTGFLIAICENISAMIPRLNELGIWGYAVTTAVLMPVLILLSWIEKVKDMWFLSVFGI